MLFILLVLLLFAIISIAISLVFIFVASLFMRQVLRKKRKIEKSSDDRLIVGLFHPYCNAGGGGERVLWSAVKYLQIRYPVTKFVIYTGDTNASPEEILSNAKKRFNIELSSPVEFVYLHRRRWVEGDKYPYFTLLAQAVGSIYLGLEAIFKIVPDIYIDTMGYGFTLPLFKWVGECKVGCYVHYPTISTDMLQRVANRTSSYNNRSSVARSPFLTYLKLNYYKLFAKFYKFAGKAADIVMVNSSWTEEHMKELWEIPSRTFKVYPPCDVEDLKKIEIKEMDENAAEINPIRIISLAQFRPEKDHPLQIRTMFALRQLLPEKEWDRTKLVLIGSCRNKEDEERVKDMKDLAKHLSVEDNVEFKINISYDELKQEFANGLIGIHTMWNEHFGIGIVECMAAGLMMVANRSGGPLMDIVMEFNGSRNGFLATDEHDYANTIQNIMLTTEKYRQLIRNNARSSVDRFSERTFCVNLLEATESLFN